MFRSNKREKATAVLSALLLLLGSACAAPDTAQRNVITVEGVVTARGNEPQVRYVLETTEGNIYVLRIPEEDRAAFQTPARLRVTGRNYADEWDSHTFAHIEVSKWERVD